jgi:hypothetical protein
MIQKNAGTAVPALFSSCFGPLLDRCFSVATGGSSFRFHHFAQMRNPAIVLLRNTRRIDTAFLVPLARQRNDLRAERRIVVDRQIAGERAHRTRRECNFDGTVTPVCECIRR